MRFLIIITTVFLAISAQAQLRLDFSTYTYYYENLLKIYLPKEDFMMAPSLNLSYTDAQYRIYYYGYLSNLKNYPQYNYQYHEIGAEYYHAFGKKIYSYWGIDFALRRNRTEYDYYNFNRFQAYSIIKWYPQSWMLIKFGTTLQFLDFSKEEAWQHGEFLIWLQQNFFLKTKTTLRWGIDFRYRNFAPYTLSAGEIGWIPGIGYITQENDDARYELPDLWQLYAVGRIAQSLGPYLGAYSDIAYRYNPSGSNPYEFEVQGFSPIDDYFGYGGYDWSNSLKLKLKNDLWLRLRHILYERQYLNRMVYLFDFDTGTWPVDENNQYIINEPNREDYGSVLEFSAGYQLNRLFRKAANLELVAALYWRNNHSNDPYFEYADKTLNVMLRYNIQW
jgi:hypothetical protein